MKFKYFFSPNFELVLAPTPFPNYELHSDISLKKKKKLNTKFLHSMSTLVWHRMNDKYGTLAFLN